MNQRLNLLPFLLFVDFEKMNNNFLYFLKMKKVLNKVQSFFKNDLKKKKQEIYLLLYERVDSLIDKNY